MTDTIDIRWSPDARTRATELLAAHPEARGFRLRLKEAGCAGWNYVFSLAPAPAEDELRLESGGLALFVPAAQRALVAGTTIDFVKEGLNRVFRFTHPRAREVCGCGESFTLGDEVAPAAR
jgi:Fe-S cluster assembly protein SufA